MTKIADLTWGQLSRAWNWGDPVPGVRLVFWTEWQPWKILFVGDDGQNYRMHIHGPIERLVPVTRLEWQAVSDE